MAPEHYLGQIQQTGERVMPSEYRTHQSGRTGDNHDDGACGL